MGIENGQYSWTMEKYYDMTAKQEEEHNFNELYKWHSLRWEVRRLGKIRKQRIQTPDTDERK